MKTCVVLMHLQGVLRYVFTTLEASREACLVHGDVFKVLGYATLADFF